MIDWLPIADMPPEMKDGRDLLFWRDDMGAAVWPSYVGWELVTHYAEITPPEGE